MHSPLNILLLGSGGREHAFARSLGSSPLCNRLFIAPGNAGTRVHGTNVNVSPSDFTALKELVILEQIGMVVVGPEDPLVKGIRDFFEADKDLKTVPVIGPTSAGAQLEGSKDFAKAFMQRHGIPTAAYQTFTYAREKEGHTFLESLHPPYVLKADGLAAGKGVLILDDLKEAKNELSEILGKGKFGEAGSKVVVEAFLPGIEVSVFVLTDGKNYIILPEAKDYKRIGEGDKGLNTGGMGAVSPVAFADAAFMKKVEERIVKPSIAGLVKENIAYRGFLFIGLMNVAGDPYVIEYNCRMGDPETEAVLPRIKNDFVELMQAVAEGRLDEISLETDPRTAVTVVMVSGGYPGSYEKGFPVRHLDKAGETMVFHAGTSLSGDEVITNGGRVLALTSLGHTLEEARSKSYAAAKAINFDYAYYRNDIGLDLLSLKTEKQV